MAWGLDALHALCAPEGGPALPHPTTTKDTCTTTLTRTEGRADEMRGLIWREPAKTLMWPCPGYSRKSVDRAARIADLWGRALVYVRI